MDSNQAILLLKGFSALCGENAPAQKQITGAIEVIERQEETTISLQQRVRELDEKNQTQAMVLAARDKIIQAQAVYKITEKIFIDPEVRQQIKVLIEQQAQEIAKKDRMIRAACFSLSSRSDGFFWTEEKWLAWLEKEAERD